MVLFKLADVSSLIVHIHILNKLIWKHIFKAVV